jgi:hypothetical protein
MLRHRVRGAAAYFCPPWAAQGFRFAARNCPQGGQGSGCRPTYTRALHRKIKTSISSQGMPLRPQRRCQRTALRTHPRLIAATSTTELPEPGRLKEKAKPIAGPGGPYNPAVCGRVSQSGACSKPRPTRSQHAIASVTRPWELSRLVDPRPLDRVRPAACATQVP